MTPSLAKPESSANSDLDLYRVFASCFSHPSPDRFAWLCSREFRRLLKTLSVQFSQELQLPVGCFPSYPAYEAAYISLFEVGVPGPPVPLLESVYSRSGAAQEIVLDCVNFYDVLGLRPSGSVFPVDHLVTQLEFLSAVRFLRENEALSENREPLRRLERDFIERHLLSWLSSALEKLEKLNPPLFPALLSLLAADLKNEFRHGLIRPRRESG